MPDLTQSLSRCRGYAAALGLVQSQSQVISGQDRPWCSCPPGALLAVALSTGGVAPRREPRIATFVPAPGAATRRDGHRPGAGQVEMPSKLYSGHTPAAPVTSGTTPM